MKNGMLRKTISAALLLYFFLFVIPPDSAFEFGNVHAVHHNGHKTLVQDYSQARNYIIDLYIWFTLKRSCCSQKTTISRENLSLSAGSVDLPALVAAILSHQHEMLALSVRVPHNSVSGHLSHFSEIFFTRSGSSPPLSLVA
jgi:hypothetical protein